MSAAPEPSVPPPRPAPHPSRPPPPEPGPALPEPGPALPEPGSPAPWLAEPFPHLAVVAQAGAGFLLLGLAGSAGRASLGTAAVLPIVILGLAVMPGLISAPALVVLHQHGGRSASPEVVLRALVEAWMEAGRVAGGLASVVLFFSLTSLMGTELLFVSLGLAGLLGLSAARRRLRQAEQAVAKSPRGIGVLLWGWSVLTLLIGARLTWMAITWLQQAR